MNGTFFLEDLLLSLKYEMIGFLIPIVSRSASLSEENFLPVSPFLCKWFTILSSTPIWRKKVIISSVLKDDKFPSFGIVISFSGINLETVLLGGLLVRIRGGILSDRGGSLGSGGGCSIFGTGGKPRLVRFCVDEVVELSLCLSVSVSECPLVMFPFTCPFIWGLLLSHSAILPITPPYIQHGLAVLCVWRNFVQPEFMPKHAWKQSIRPENHSRNEVIFFYR